MISALRRPQMDPNNVWHMTTTDRRTELERREAALTEQVLHSFDDTPSPRVRELLQGLVRHLHAYARDVRLTEPEWKHAIDFLTRTGQMSDDRRQEFILLSDVLGLSMLTIAVNAPADPAATEPTVFGPFFVHDAPEIEYGGDVAQGAPGDPCWVEGQITSTDGTPLGAAEIEVWEADEDGLYDVQYDDGRTAGRARMTADGHGRYGFWSVKPAAYPIPGDGPVGELLRAAARSPMRPAHIHFMVSAPGHRTLVTHVFAAGGPHLDDDAVFGVKTSLIEEFSEQPPGGGPHGRDARGPLVQARLRYPTGAEPGLMADTVRTDVLVVGSGPAGGAAALSLATLGVDHIVITKYSWTANTPRSHITNQRTVEIFRDLGIEADITANGTPQRLMGDTVFCTSLSGDEIGRVRTWGTHPARQADYTLASPCEPCDLPQTLLEPILIGNAAARGSHVRFDTEYLGLDQDHDGVRVRVRDRIGANEYVIEAKYVIGADGGRSQIAADIELPFEGQMDLAGSMNIVFHADLSAKVAHRPSVLYWVLQPGSDIGGIGMGLVRMVRPWDEWLIVWGFDINDAPPELDDAAAIQIVHNLIGDDTVPVTIRSTSLWGNNKMYATRYRQGRVFCMGDAVHRHPPSNGLGSNTSVQDAYNLAWKLAFVLRGDAAPGLLDSYDAERAPVGRQIVLRANKSIEEFGPIFAALGFADTSDPEVMTERMRARADDTPEAARQREQLREALELKDYEFNAHGVELGQRYRSGAVIPDGTPEPGFTRDPELYYHPTTWPGARLPHCWLGRAGHRISTHDLAGKGRFALLTGISGQRWAHAASGVAHQLGIEIAAYVIGPGREYTDLYDDWARVREVGEDGCILVRPDAHVAWRAATLVDDPERHLRTALDSILNPTPGSSSSRKTAAQRS